MVRLFLATIVSVQILQCATAAFDPKICAYYNRQEPQVNAYFHCGDCVEGYKENGRGQCQVASITCPSESECDGLTREPCTESTRGECGPCKIPYVELYGFCVTKQVSDELLEALITAYNEMSPTDQSDAAEQETLVQQTSPEASATKPNEDLYLDKKAEVSVDGQPIVSPPQPQPPQLQLAVLSTDSAADTDRTAEDNSNTDTNSGEKRVPAADSPSGMSPYRYVGGTNSAASEPGASKSVTGRELPGDLPINQLVFFVVILGVSLLCVTSLIVAGVCWYRLYKQKKSMETADYTGYGDYTSKPGLANSESGDRKLAQSAQMYHYQHHKQQMMAQGKSLSEKMDDESDADDDEPVEDEDGQYTVYMCPGLAPLGEMEIENPVFQGNKQGNSPTSPHSDRSASSKNSS